MANDDVKYTKDQWRVRVAEHTWPDGVGKDHMVLVECETSKEHFEALAWCIPDAFGMTIEDGVAWAKNMANMGSSVT